MKCPNRCLLKGILTALGILILLCTIGLLTGCASSENSRTGFHERFGCIFYPPEGEHDATIERALVVGETEDDQWLVIRPDNFSNREPEAMPKARVRFMGCPGTMRSDPNPFDASMRSPQ